MALRQLHFLSPSTPFNFSFSSKPKRSHLKRIFLKNPVHGGVIYASSAEKPRKKKGRPSRAAMSDEDLCKELQEVMSVAGLPANRVPLMKELCEHGRNDLANIVRRRGYKVVWLLLSTSNLNDNHRDNSSVEDLEPSDLQGDEASEFEVTHLSSAESISSLRISSEDHNADTNGTMKHYIPVQVGESYRSSTGPVNLVAACSYQKRELNMNVSGTNTEVHAFEEEQLLGSDQIINQTKRMEANGELASNMVFDDNNSITEIDDLKVLLHQTEMELAELKQHIEKEKEAVTLLQAWAQNEIHNVHRVIVTKDDELRACKDELCGLKEVEVQFCVIGETVEVAGSFNGWHNSIKMNLHPSSKTIYLQGLRASKLWSTILWLYPGIYEIKFIVDGQWMIDPLREIANSHITNNVLRVDR